MNLTKRIGFRLVALISVLLLPLCVLAGPITWNFSATVEYTDFGSGSYWTDIGVSVGDLVSGKVTFDTAAAETASYGVDETGGTTFNTPFLTGVASIHTLTVNGMVYSPVYSSELTRLRSNFDTTTGNFGIPNTSPFDTFDVGIYEPGFERFMISRIATSAGEGTLVPGSYPSVAPNITDLLRGHIYLQEVDSNGDTSGLMAVWTSVEQVPEPSGLLILSSGLLLMCVRKNQRDQKSERLNIAGRFFQERRDYGTD